MPELNTFLYLGIIIFAGVFGGRLVKQLRLPNVTGYLIAGLILGPSISRIIPSETLESFEIVSEIALGFIAVTIGSSFKISFLKAVGKTPIVITAFEALFATVAVTGTLLALGYDATLALCLGAIAAATAPAATILIINQYKAKGPVTNTLLTVVAMDDAAALMLFGIATGIAKTIEGGTSGSSLVLSIVKPLVEIVASLAIGFVFGLAFTWLAKYFRKSGNRLALIAGFIFLGTGIAEMLSLSSLLLLMSVGIVIANKSKDAPAVFSSIDAITPPIFIMFFVISGAELDISILPQLGVIGIVYITTRVVGKLFGSYLASVITKAPTEVRKYLGLALVPQAGVAIGLTIIAGKIVPEYADQIRAVILGATLIYEMVGPVLSKLALTKSGEISSEALHKSKA